MSISRVIGTVSANPQLPQLDYHELVAAGVHVPEFIETGLDGDWSFDLPDPETFRSRTSLATLDTTGRSYSLQDNVAGKYLQLAPGSVNGIPGPTVDAHQMTYGGIFNWRESEGGAIQVLMQTSSASAANGGEVVQIGTTNSVGLQVRGYTNNITITAEALDISGINWAGNNTFVFVAVTSRITTGDETEHTLFVGGPEPVVVTGSGEKIVSTIGSTIAIGNAYRDEPDFHAMPTRCGRFFSASRPSTVAELTAIYRRAQVIAARRGVAVE